MSRTTPHRPGWLAASVLVVVSVLALIACGSPRPVQNSTPAPSATPVPATAAPLATPSFGLTLPFPREADQGKKPVFATVEEIPIMGFYVNNGSLVLAPHEAARVEVLLISEPTALLSAGGIVLNFIHPAGFATQVYLWQGQAVQQDKSGGYKALALTPQQPSISYGPVYRGQVVGIAGAPFPQSHFKGANLLLTLAKDGGDYVPPDALWLFGKPQYIATPTPAK